MKTKKRSYEDVEEDATSSPQNKFTNALSVLDNALVERGEENRLAMTALIAQEHVLFIGPPGTAKSLTVESIRRWISGAKSCVVHCCKDTTRSMAFGPIDLQSIKERVQKRILDGGAADCHVLILEEVFKSGPAVLDMFLLLMNERKIQEGVFSAKAPLRLLLGVSNEWSPDGCETALAAFFDRFLFRRAVKPVSKAGRRELLTRSVDGTIGEVVFPETISLTEIDQAHKEAMVLPWTNDAKKALWDVLEELNAQGIFPGDRRVTPKSIIAARAYAYLLGADKVEVEHLEVLKDVLWVDPTEQPDKAAKIILKLVNPIGMAINDLKQQAESVLAKEGSATEAAIKIEELMTKANELPEDPRRDKAILYLSECHRKALNRTLPSHMRNKE